MQRHHIVVGILIVAFVLLVLTLGIRSRYLACCVYTITYRVEGSVAEANISYYPGDSLFSSNTIRELERVALPWEVTLTSDHYFHRQHAMLSVIGPPDAEFRCQVSIDGIVAEALTDAGTVVCGYDPERNPISPLP